MYDLVILGDGIFGKLFLYELNKYVTKSQNLKVARVFDEKLAPNCSLRTTSTVSENGIEEGISELGDELLKAFNAFKEFYISNQPDGIYEAKQYVANSEDKLDKLIKRYKEKVSEIDIPLLKKELNGVELDSYIVSPELFFKYISVNNPNFALKDYSLLCKKIENIDGVVKLTLIDDTEISTKKLVMATGAYSVIHKELFESTLFYEKINFTKVVAGSYLKKSFKHFEDLYLTLNGHNLVYRHKTQELIIGSTTVQGPITSPDIAQLKDIFKEVKDLVTLDLGEFSDYEMITGLRHKGQKRMPFFKPITTDESIWFFNGAYKNGWSLPFYYIKRDLQKVLGN